MRILAIDPGSKLMGYAVVEFDRREVLHEFGLVRITACQERNKFLRGISDEVAALADKWSCDAGAIETGFAVVRHRGQNVMRGSLALGEVRGAVMVGLGHCAHFIGINPSTVKKAMTGNGRADKNTVQRFARAMFNLDREPSEDEADAIAVGVAAMRRIGR